MSRQKTCIINIIYFTKHCWIWWILWICDLLWLLIQLPLVLKTKEWGTLPLAVSVLFCGLGDQWVYYGALPTGMMTLSIFCLLCFCWRGGDRLLLCLYLLLHLWDTTIFTQVQGQVSKTKDWGRQGKIRLIHNKYDEFNNRCCGKPWYFLVDMSHHSKYGTSSIT